MGFATDSPPARRPSCSRRINVPSGSNLGPPSRRAEELDGKRDRWHTTLRLPPGGGGYPPCVNTAHTEEQPHPHVSILVDGTVVFRGESAAVPREGDQLVFNGKVVRVQSVTWTFGADQASFNVDVAIADREYTY